MINYIKKFITFIRLTLSENGQPSSKRCLAALIFCVVLFCTTHSIMKYGMTDNNKSVIEFEIVTAGALLGVTSVTSIWKNNNNSPQDDLSSGFEPKDEE